MSHYKALNQIFYLAIHNYWFQHGWIQLIFYVSPQVHTWYFAKWFDQFYFLLNLAWSSFSPCYSSVPWLFVISCCHLGNLVSEDSWIMENGIIEHKMFLNICCDLYIVEGQILNFRFHLFWCVVVLSSHRYIPSAADPELF